MEEYTQEYTPIPIQLEWKISEENLRAMSDDLDFAELNSDKKDINLLHDCKYGLKASIEKNPNEDNNGGILKMSLSLHDLYDDEVKVHGKFAFCVKSADFVTEYKCAVNAPKDNVYYDYDYKDPWTREICSVNDLFDAEKKFIVDEHLTVELKGMFFVEYCPDYIAKEKLGDYLFNSDDKDFVIVVGKEEDKEKTEIQVHKCVLRAHSTVFKKMLETDMKEKAESKVEITDFDANVVQAAVDYCYDQGLCLANGLALLQFSDKYDIQDLKDELEVRFMKVQVTPQNICEIANAAIISNAPNLRDFCCRTLLIYMRQAIPVEKFADLDKEFSDDLITKAFSGKYY